VQVHFDELLGNRVLAEVRPVTWSTWRSSHLIERDVDIQPARLRHTGWAAGGQASRREQGYSASSDQEPGTGVWAVAIWELVV